MAFLHSLTLLIAAVQLLTVPCAGLTDKEWWETTLVYQIWPRGFQDSDGDGEGDLKGIISRLDYIKDLGIDTIWLNPIYSSPLIDSGYDISNYTDINPVFGNFEHFDELVEGAHERDLKVILDIVPNHSSDEHEWFLLSSENIEPYNNYYIWSKGSTDDYGNNIPPNNWASTYDSKEGSAWTWHDARKEWYYHKFHTSQPDLNLRNENVVQELLNVFNFWLKRNVDGFRINAVSYFFEDEDLRDDPSTGNEIHTFGLPENAELLYTFRAYIDEWIKSNKATSKLLIAESFDPDDTLILYYGNSTHDGIPPINLRFITHIHNSSNAEYIKEILEEWFEKLPDNASTNWVLSNHDNSRAASRIGLNRVDGLHMLSLLLPGQAYTYYGDEIAMLDKEVLWNETIDPMGCSKSKATYNQFSRDPARTPMQWNSTTSAGFSTNESTYLPIHPTYVNRNVETQENQNRSNVNTYKLLTTIRKDVVFTHGDYEFATLNDNRIFILKRFLDNNPVYIIVVNLGLHQERVNLSLLYPNLGDNLEVVVASSNAAYITKTVSKNDFILSANAAVVLKGYEVQKTTTEVTTGTVITSTSGTEEPSSTTTEPRTSSEISTEISTPEITTFSPSSSTSTEAGHNSATSTVFMVQPIISTILTVMILLKF